MRSGPAVLTFLFAITLAAAPRAEGGATLTLPDALRAAHAASPDLIVARTRERVAHTEVDVAGTIPNPTAIFGTSTQTARFSGTLSVPLVILGQRRAAVDAARAEERTSTLDTLVTWNDVRQATAHAYVNLWLAGGVAAARRAALTIQQTLESSIAERVRVGAAPEIDALRVHAERLRAEADRADAEARADAAGAELERWMGSRVPEPVRAAQAAPLPVVPPRLADLSAAVDSSISVRREQSDAQAAAARANRERAFVRPGLVLDVGADVGDPTLNDETNYRVQIAIDVPVFNQRGAYVTRERAAADVARAREDGARIQAGAELSAAYRLYQAATEQERILTEGVIPASEGAARATGDAYVLGRAPLVAVLDADRALIDARLSALTATAARAAAWADVEHAVGQP